MNTSFHINNKVTNKLGTKETLYDLWKGRDPNIKYFHVFGSKCYIMADREQRGKWIPRVKKVYSLVNP